MLSWSCSRRFSFDFEADCVGEKLLVMIEGYLPDEHAYVGRNLHGCARH